MIFDDIVDIKGIADEELGKNYITDKLLLAWNQKKSHSIFVVEDGGEILGFNVLISGGIEEILNEIGDKFKARLSEINHDGPFILIKSTAIIKDYQGQGIWSDLYHYSVAAMNGSKKTLMCVGWKKGAHIPLKSILMKRGFSEIAELNNYWKEESLLKGYICPICGTPPCLCSAVIFLRTK